MHSGYDAVVAVAAASVAASASAAVVAFAEFVVAAAGSVQRCWVCSFFSS